MQSFCRIAALLLLSLPGIAQAHEYYLLPESFTPASKNEFAVSHKLGQLFKGNEMPFINSWNIRSEVWENGKTRNVRGKDGDRPALKVVGNSSALMAIIHQSNVDFLTFASWEKFQAYVNKEGLEHALAASERGEKPKEKLKEAYARYAKTLVALDGNTEGMDQPTGLKIEIMALEHPLKLAADQPMPVQILYDGQPLAGAKIKVFIGIGNEFSHQIYSDAEGKAAIPAEGPGPYLLNAIHMTEPQGAQAKEKNAHWESFWASLTYQRAR
ncbi:MAG: DUF4198 domain-containing protein [Rhizobiaceae bacterium]